MVRCRLNLAPVLFCVPRRRANIVGDVRFVGLVMVPGKHIVKIEVEEDT
jgi:hypothetical protein